MKEIINKKTKKSKKLNNLLSVPVRIVILILILGIGATLFLIFKNNNSAYNLGTLGYNGTSFPKFPSDYILINKEKDNTIDYLVSLPHGQISKAINAVCKSNGYTVDMLDMLGYNDMWKKFQADYSSSCYDSNNQWEFDVYSAAAISFESWMPHVKSSYLKGDLTKKSWLQVFSTATAPIWNAPANASTQ